MNQPKPIPETFDDIFNDIEKGLIKIPQFQRDFVWSINQSAQLIDSILKGYPIGTFIFWKTKEELRSIRNIGNLKLLDIPKGDFVKYILDGQQRITSIYAAIKGAIVEREKITSLKIFLKYMSTYWLQNWTNVLYLLMLKI